jgi:hypothetical protein
VLISVGLQTPSKKPLAEGEVELEWFDAAGKPLIGPPPPPPHPHPDCSHVQEQIAELESEIDADAAMADIAGAGEKAGMLRQEKALVQEIELIRRNCAAVSQPSKPTTVGVNPGEVSDFRSVTAAMTAVQKAKFAINYYKSAAPLGTDLDSLSPIPFAGQVREQELGDRSLRVTPTIVNVPAYPLVRLKYAYCQAMIGVSPRPTPDLC